ncbi:preprotein translocase subunit SecY, partial [bacterium]|nr:preprotein translocase subunit SecY [bacterium]
MVLFKNFKNIFSISELRRKILYTLGVLVVYRLGSFIPVIGVNLFLLRDYMERASGVGGLLGYLDIFSGGSLRQCTLFALGISPYITASIMMQLLSMIIPSLEQLAKEGDYGRRIINQYTRYLTLGLSVFYSLTYAALLESQGLVLTPGLGFKLTFVVSLTVGALFVMWLGEQLSLYGIGVNGSSLIIFAGIVARLPKDIAQTGRLVSIGTVG